MKKVLNFISGEWQEPRAAKYLSSLNPATTEKIAEIPDSQKEDVELAVAAAKKAFKDWNVIPASERALYLHKIANLIEARQQEFAETESRDQGKPVSLALKMDIARVIQNFRFFAENLMQQESQFTEMSPETFNYTLRKPIGVAALIAPWNLPLYLLSWKIAPAIAYGNTVICKPSEFTSLSSDLLGQVLKAAALPPGVVNIVYGLGESVGAALVQHPEVPVISFTGGTKTGQKILADSASLIKKVSLELGGKNPNIIFDDADLKTAVATTVRSSFLNQGEICLCGSRIYVQEKIYDRFREEFLAQVKKLKVGDPKLEETFMGPLVSREHLQKIQSYIELAKKEDGVILCGGDSPALSGDLAKGYFLNPTVIEGLKESSACIQEEIFGPVVTLSKFSSFDEVVEKANAVKYGLSASVWTQSLSTAHKIARALNVGTVWVNSWLVRDLRVPFGGTKSSGLGREGGQNSIDFFTETTTVSVRI